MVPSHFAGMRKDEPSLFENPRNPCRLHPDHRVIEAYTIKEISLSENEA